LVICKVKEILAFNYFNERLLKKIIITNTIFLNWLSSLKSILSTRIYHYYKIIKLIIRYYFKYKFTINGQ